MIPRKRLDIPEYVSGRRVTNRGVHLLPTGYHGDWLKRAGYWTDLMVSMGISWVVVLTDGDAVRQNYNGVNPIKVLLDAGIIPIIREHKLFPQIFTEHDTVRWTVDFYGQYGLKPFWIIRNEPFDDREWVGQKVPPNGWDIIIRTWAHAAQFVAGAGGYVGFPDGPCYPFNPFESLKAYDVQWIFDQGLGYYTGHHYGKNRPRDYPRDAVTRYGAQLTEEAYRRLLDDYADDRTWWEEPIELINQRRTALQNPSVTSIDDDTCWRGWEKVAYWSQTTFGYVVPMAMTEGGWVPRDRAGTGPNTDIRMPHTTPKMVGKKTLQMFDAASPFFAICPWLLADDAMVAGGYVGWPFDAWVGWAYADRYGPEKPVVSMLKSVPPKETIGGQRAEPMVIDVDSDTRDWTWISQAYGATYQRGNPKLRLLEVHEYEGPAVLEAQVVDIAGLPVEGIQLYYDYPGAPAIVPDADTPAEGEWRTTGLAGVTGADGRVCFTPHETPAPPGASQGALWPKGRGDILEHVGLLAGTRNRHLNAQWQFEGALPPSEPPEKPVEKPPVTTGWKMDVEYFPGNRIIIGRLPEANLPVTITDAFGHAATVTSGSKAEYGVGGFEVLAPHLVEYTIAFLDQVFKLTQRDGATIATFTKSEVPPAEPPAEPPTEPPTKPPAEPPTEPPTKPPVEPPTEPPTKPPTEPPAEPPTKPPADERWAQVHQKLDRIVTLIETATRL